MRQLTAHNGDEKRTLHLAEREQQRTGLGLRAKLALVALSLLALPYVGVQYVREMESHLRGGLEEAVRVSGQAIAGALRSRSEWFVRDELAGGQEIFVHDFAVAPQLDGYVDDWADVTARAQATRYAGLDDQQAARFSVARFGGYLYVLVRVPDDQVRLPPAYGTDIGDGDYVEFLLTDNSAVARRFMVTTPSTGNAAVHEIPYAGYTQGVMNREYRMTAYWQNVAGGYNVEFKIPLNLLGSRFALVIGDADHEQSLSASTWRATVEDPTSPVLGELVYRSEGMQEVVQALGPAPGRRITVVDRKTAVRATVGNLNRASAPATLNPIYTWILRPPRGDIFSDQVLPNEVCKPEVLAALAGDTAIQWRQTRDENVMIVSAAIPIPGDADILGAVVVEESTLSILSANRQALISLFNKTLLAAALGGFALLLYASRLSWRLRRLRDETDRAIDEHGRVVAPIEPSSAADEIGDLSRGFAEMSERLRAYNSYLEQLARRLSHELRTPLAVVRSSLDNLETEPLAGDARVFTLRARDGVARLEAIITRMGESSRLENALRSAEVERLDIADLLRQAVSAYAGAWPDIRFESRIGGEAVHVSGSGDLIMQMLDKIVSNAHEFAAPGTPILLQLASTSAKVTVSVINSGPSLPADAGPKLFDSMVSIRTDVGADTPHLGLGLYVARMISDFHGGRIGAENLPNEHRVRVWFELPRC